VLRRTKTPKYYPFIYHILIDKVVTISFICSMILLGIFFIDILLVKPSFLVMYVTANVWIQNFIFKD